MDGIDYRKCYVCGEYHPKDESNLVYHKGERGKHKHACNRCASMLYRALEPFMETKPHTYEIGDKTISCGWEAGEIVIEGYFKELIGRGR